MHDITGDPPLRRYPSGFAGLARIIIGQQLSTASAKAIFQRAEQALGSVTPGQVIQTPFDTLRATGLSRPKIATLTALATELDSGRLKVPTTPSEMNNPRARETLLDQHGIGPWTVDIYEMFCIGHSDAFAPGDLALREAARRILCQRERPSQPETLELAERWRPFRSVSAGLLWAYYATGHGKD